VRGWRWRPRPQLGAPEASSPGDLRGRKPKKRKLCREGAPKPGSWLSLNFTCPEQTAGQAKYNSGKTKGNALYEPQRGIHTVQQTVKITAQSSGSSEEAAA
jgi:hypothetical protein